MASISLISLAPVKGLALVHPHAVELGLDGVEGDRRYYLVDAAGRLVNQKWLGSLTCVSPEVGDGRLLLRFPGEVVEGEVELGSETSTSFYGRPVAGRFVLGPWSEALSEHARTPLRLVRTELPGEGIDRGRRAGATLVSTGSLRALAEAAGTDAVDARRFRMLLTLDGLEAHGEDAWIGRHVRAGGAVIRVEGNVGRCVVTSRDPDTGERDLATLDVLASYRGGLQTSEPLPFGVWASVVEPGVVRVGDAVVPF